MDAILIPTLQLKLRTIRTPEVWQHTYDTFADQDHDNVKAQILVGADKSTLFPIAEMDSNGKPIETGKCRLMRSRITNKLIPFGAYEDNQDHQEIMNPEGFKSTNFGFKDTSSLAVTSNYKMWSLHQKNFLEETYKLYPEERDQVTEIPKKAVIDDILILSSLYE